MRTLVAGVAVLMLTTSLAAQDAAQLQRMAARFAPTPLRVDTSRLSGGDRQALPKLIQAARILNHIYMQQLWSGDLALYERLKADKTPLGQARLKYFWINKGPFDDLDEFKSFIPGAPARKPLGANFYPEDLTKEEFESWANGLPAADKEAALGFFTVIRRDSRRTLMAIPYSQEYRADLVKAADLLRQAAALTDNDSLKRFLTSRADAYLSNSYRESDMAWMDLDAPLDITIGPYETYTDELFGYKAAFEAYVNLRDDAETNKISALSQHLQEIEDNLPEDPQYRNPKLGAGAPLRVVNEILAAGDGAHGITTAAYNLPNDEEVVQQKGSKRVMLRNVQEAKFRTVLIPIATRMLVPKSRPDLSFDMFFTHTVCHELMHGLGPHVITVNGQQTSPRQQLKELYSAWEEAKADATGLFALQYMMDHAKEMKLDGVLHSGPAAERQLYTTYLASSFRSMRFGTGDAHGRGMAMQFNYLVDKGAFVAQPDGTYAVDFSKIKGAVSDLTHDLLTVEATGDYASAKDMLTRMAVIRPEVQAQLERLQSIPVDIDPQYVTADEIAPENGKPPARTPRHGHRPRRARR